MDRSDINWNTTIKIDSLLRTKIKKKFKSVWKSIVNVFSFIFNVIFCKDFWDYALCLFLVIGVFVLLIGLVAIPIMSIRHVNQVEKAREVEETRLKESGWICIECSDKVSAELLARKRSDAEFGVDNYSFQATNTINYKFWYLVGPKTNSTKRIETR